MWDAYLRLLSSKTRYQMRRGVKQLHESGAGRFPVFLMQRSKSSKPSAIGRSTRGWISLTAIRVNNITVAVQFGFI